jgi:hypothetical protein
MSDAYHALAAFDDLAFAALKISLSEPEQSIIVERLREDWMTDVGVIGLLRRQHIETQSVRTRQTLLGIATRTIESAY